MHTQEELLGKLMQRQSQALYFTNQLNYTTPHKFLTLRNKRRKNAA